MRACELRACFSVRVDVSVVAVGVCSVFYCYGFSLDTTLLLQVPKPSIEQLNLDVSQFVELLAQDGGKRTRLSGVLDATNEAATIPQAGGICLSHFS